METRVDEIADRIFRLSTFVPKVAGVGLTFNQFLIDADRPLLFHTGQRALFPSVSAAVARIIDMNKLRWITFSHVESDECGSLNEWLAAAPNATAAHGRIGCNIWLNDTAARPPRALADGERIDLGGKTVRRIDTPHLPHCWDAGLLFEETTATLLTSDLFTQTGEPQPLTSEDISGASIETERLLPFSSLSPTSAALVRKLAALQPRTLAIMHGSSFSGDGATMLEALASHYERELRRALAS
ncbi:MAG TPA: hypothetical protein VEJ86_01885 [Candidatus Binataceae bacterium]|nr:hypothetical protein [Candidatus Binataceae bacterium]